MQIRKLRRIEISGAFFYFVTFYQKKFFKNNGMINDLLNGRYNSKSKKDLPHLRMPVITLIRPFSFFEISVSR